MFYQENNLRVVVQTAIVTKKQVAIVLGFTTLDDKNTRITKI